MLTTPPMIRHYKYRGRMFVKLTKSGQQRQITHVTDPSWVLCLVGCALTSATELIAGIGYAR